MENAWSWEQKTLISELIQGMELAKQLKANLTAPSSAETRDLMVQKILSSYENSLLILNWSGSMGQQQTTGRITETAALPESPISMNGSPRSDDLDGCHRENLGYNDVSKKRKTTPRWTEQVRVSSEDGLEGPHDDGYSWRKYGQKDILGAKYPRSYYRCTYRNTQNCEARKQVQRSDEDPTIFDVTYRGMHTCSQGNQPILPPASPKKQEQRQNSNYKPQQSQEARFNFQKAERGNNEDLDKETVSPFSFPSTHECVKSVGNYSPSFTYPPTPEPNYYSMSTFQMNNFGGVQSFQRPDSGFTEIIPANTSATNSPIVDFSVEQVEFDPNFPFDSPGFSLNYNQDT